MYFWFFLRVLSSFSDKNLAYTRWHCEYCIVSSLNYHSDIKEVLWKMKEAVLIEFYAILIHEKT